MILDAARDWKGKILKILEELENGIFLSFLVQWF